MEKDNISNIIEKHRKEIVEKKDECNHNFVYSHTEVGVNGTTTDLPECFDVVVCPKCGEIKRIRTKKSYQ